MEMKRIEDNLRPYEPEHKKHVKFDFVTEKMNPFQDRHQTKLTLIPRVVVTPCQSEHPYYLEVAKTLNKSEYYLYEHIKVNYNVHKVKEVQGQDIYALLLRKQKEK